MPGVGAGLTITTAIALYLALRPGKKKAEPAPAPSGDRPAWIVPVWDPSSPNSRALVSEQICTSAAEFAGETILAPVLEEKVWRVIWQGVPWPVRTDDHATVQVASAVLHDLVLEYLKDPAQFCGQPKTPEGPTPIDLSKIENVYPTPGLMYQVRKGDVFGGTFGDRSIAYRALLTAGYLAGKRAGLDDEAANQFARSIAKDNGARTRYIELILCTLLNDLYYGTWGFDGSKTMAGPHGRGIRLLAVNPNNRSRLAAGQTPLRSIQRLAAKDKGNGAAKGTGSSLEYLQLPPLDFDILLNTELPTVAERIQVAPHADGSPGLAPLPEVARVMSTVGLPSGRYGCSPVYMDV